MIVKTVFVLLIMSPTFNNLPDRSNGISGTQIYMQAMKKFDTEAECKKGIEEYAKNYSANYNSSYWDLVSLKCEPFQEFSKDAAKKP
jgi:hypothetical protein